MKRNSSLQTTRDGREICNLKTVGGKHIYWERLEAMWTRQKGVCCLFGYCPSCPGKLLLDDATFEHEDGRGMNGSKRDDRIKKNGLRFNGAAHWHCNNWKGSRKINYNDLRSNPTSESTA